MNKVIQPFYGSDIHVDMCLFMVFALYNIHEITLIIQFSSRTAKWCNTKPLSKHATTSAWTTGRLAYNKYRVMHNLIGRI